MKLPLDVSRCGGFDCPSKHQCQRYTDRHTTSEHTAHAALWARREQGADACDLIIPTAERLSTFDGNRMEAS